MKILLLAVTFLFNLLGGFSLNETQFPWSKNRKLTWNDFNGKPVKTMSAAALTYTDIQMNASFIDGKASIEVKNYFDSKLSWSKNKTSAQLLAHEQLHFDITELYTRIIRKRLNEIVSEQTIRDGTINTESSKLLKEWRAFQLKYDEETNHGVLLDKQKAWETKVAEMLAN